MVISDIFNYLLFRYLGGIFELWAVTSPPTMQKGNLLLFAASLGEFNILSFQNYRFAVIYETCII